MRALLALLTAGLIALYPLAGNADQQAAHLVSLATVIDDINSASTVTASAYTLSPHGKVARALARAAQRGARVSLVLNGHAIGGADRDNDADAATFNSEGIRTQLSSEALHMKAIVVNGTDIYVSDRNWTSSSRSLILQLPTYTRFTVERAILGRSGSVGAFTTRKADSLTNELTLIAHRSSHRLLVETESFGDGPIAKTLKARAQMGDDVTLVIARFEYDQTLHEQEVVADLVRAGVHVYAGDSDQKIAVDGPAVYAGSSNLTQGLPDQIDWGFVCVDQDLAATLGQSVQSDAAAATEIHPN